MNYHQQWLQYGRNILCDVLHKIEGKIYQNIPKITVPILCVLPIFYYATKKWRSRVTVEDNYQQIINKKNNTIQSVIDCITIYDSESINTINYDIVYKKLEEYNKNYNKLSANKITDIYLFKNKKDFLNCKHYHYKVWYDSDNKKFYSKINHELIGGSNIGKFCYTAFAKEQRDNFYHSKFYNIFFAIKLFLLRNKIPKIQNPFPLYENKINIKRFMIKNSFERKNNVKATIIYHVMMKLYYCLDIKSKRRDLVCYLPIAFHNTKNINNNIGIMWLTFNETDTVESIKRKMDKNAYQIFGTNFFLANRLLSTKSSSKSTRNNVDAVITILFSEEPNNIQVSWTYNNVADYPVYVAIHSRLSGNTVHLTQTYTVNTPNFEPGELEQAEYNYLFENS
jgi:hypothetical protein